MIVITDAARCNLTDVGGRDHANAVTAHLSVSVSVLSYLPQTQQRHSSGWQTVLISMLVCVLLFHHLCTQRFDIQLQPE